MKIASTDMENMECKKKVQIGLFKPPCPEVFRDFVPPKIYQTP
jgi:hypothetical protein